MKGGGDCGEIEIDEMGWGGGAAAGGGVAQRSKIQETLAW